MIHPQAMPVKTELAYKRYTERREAIEKEIQDSLFDKYGGREHLLNEERKETQFENYGECTNFENEEKQRNEKVSLRF